MEYFFFIEVKIQSEQQAIEFPHRTASKKVDSETAVVSLCLRQYRSAPKTVTAFTVGNMSVQVATVTTQMKNERKYTFVEDST